MVPDISNNENGLWDIKPESGITTRIQPRPPKTIIINGIGLGVFSLFYLAIVPYLYIPTFYNVGFYGEPLSVFLFMQIPITIYGFIRWLTFPYIRLNAVKFHIAAFIFEIVCVACVFAALAWGQRKSAYVCCQLLLSIFPVVGIIIKIWNFKSMGRLRRKGMNVIAWICVLLYIIAVYVYAEASPDLYDTQYIIGPFR